MNLGEYHHIDYKENRRKQLEIEQGYIHRADKTNHYLTIAKAVHFRSSTQCFVIDGIDISSRFQYDRKIIQDTCFRFHNYQLDPNSKQIILVLCTDKMKKIYQLLQSLFKTYISPNTSIVYVTFDQIKPFLIENKINQNTELNNEFNITTEVNDEEIFLDYLRSSSLILIFMKYLDETYLTAVCSEYSSIFYIYLLYN